MYLRGVIYLNPALNILVVDDEIKLVEVIKSYLINAGYNVLCAYNGKDAMHLFDEEKPALVVLDLMLPDIPGEVICAYIRNNSKVPVMMLTAKTDEESILDGFNIGADDYVTKPFSPRQLVARIEALMRRCQESIIKSNVFNFNQGDLTVDSLNYEVKKQNQKVNLTPYEFKLLITLMRYPKKVFTRDELITIAMGEEYEGFDRTIDSHVKNLRQKIETDTKYPQYILTAHGLGYKFGVEY